MWSGQPSQVLEGHAEHSWIIMPIILNRLVLVVRVCNNNARTAYGGNKRDKWKSMALRYVFHGCVCFFFGSVAAVLYLAAGTEFWQLRTPKYLQAVSVLVFPSKVLLWRFL
jgi:hypothetical protein